MSVLLNMVALLIFALPVVGGVYLVKLSIPGMYQLLGMRGKWASDETLRERRRSLFWLSITLFALILYLPSFILAAIFFGNNVTDHILHIAIGIVVNLLGGVSIMFVITGCPIRWLCRHCGKSINSREPWICGFCDHENADTLRYPFLVKCESCKASPPAFLCPHCGNPTTLLANGDERHPARPIPKPLPGETDDEARARRAKEISDKKHEIDRLEQETKIKELEMKLKRFTEPPKADPRAQRGQWLKDQMDALHLNLAIMAQSMERGRQAIKEIEANPSYSPEEKKELIDYVTTQCQGFQEDIKDGRAGR